MEDHMKFIINFITKCRARMNTSRILDYAARGTIIGCGAGILLEGIAFLFPFYYVNLCAALAVLTGLLTGLVMGIMKRYGMEAAALCIDSFGFKERIITAYENRKKKDAVFECQRRNAAGILKKRQDDVKIRLCPDRKVLFILAGGLVLMIAMIFIPSPVKLLAKEQHEIHELAKEKQDEIQEVIEELEEVDMNELSPDQQAEIQNMIDSLNASITEYDQAESMEALQQAQEKLEYKYEEMAGNLNQMAENAAQNNPAGESGAGNAMQQAAGTMMSHTPSGSQNASGGQNGNSGGSQNGNNPSGNENGNGGQNGNAGNNENGNNGNSGNGNNGQNGNGGNNNGNGNNGNGEGNGSGEGNGNGEGDGNGEGEGSGEGNGNGGGDGGAGNGAGHGSGGNTPHDYVSVPNNYGNDDNLTGQAGDSDESQYYHTQNGLAWEGNHVSYDSVIGSYSQNAYEGIQQGKYPSGMEDVIKEYFGSFNE